MLIARTVAKLPEVQHELSTDKKPIDQAKVIDKTIEGIRIINKAEYIVVLNMDHIRLSHPVNAFNWQKVQQRLMKMLPLQNIIIYQKQKGKLVQQYELLFLL